ncbi:MAG: secretion pathway ATPase [Porticoccaceae bacterium]|nr:MAG: secretion pathway ATPase [Porticoccaceae bacterium]
MAEAARLLDLPGLVKALVADGRIARGEARRVLARERSPEEAALHPLTYLAAQELPDRHRPGRVLDAAALAAWLAEKAGLPLWHIDPLKMDLAAVTSIMSYEFARRHDILCVAASDEEVVVATAQPFAVREWLPAIRQVARRPVRVVFADPAELGKYRVEFYALARSVRGAGAQGQGERARSGQVGALLELRGVGEPDAQDQHIVRLVDWLLQYAFEQRASDIHLEPRREVGRVRFRIDGVLHRVYELPAGVALAMTSRLKILAGMNVAERRRPQDGRLKTRSPAGREVELRLSSLPTAFGEKLVVRIFDPDVLVRSFRELGLDGDDLARWQAMVGRPHGLVLVTGPTGSGKTTTLYSTLRQLATEEVNVSTVEDPIEMVVDAFNQTQVHPAIGLDFAAGIRTLLRQDPDIIMVGEIRDRETAQMAIQAALTGHLVLSTLHTNDAPTAVSRLRDLGIPDHLIAATLNGVMAQRLVRLLCPSCKREAPADPAAWRQLVGEGGPPPPAHFALADGCLECRNTGYLGRRGIFEILVVDAAERQLIGAGVEVHRLRAEAARRGMRSLRLAGAAVVAAGLTSVAEVLRVTADHG